jgi:hypothetical protein
MISVAKSVSVNNIPSVVDISSMSAAPCISIINEGFEETRQFSWNVENVVHKKMSFSYYVGEGPLYWYRIDWYPSRCPPNPCLEIEPTIEYIAPNCPYEIIENCIILPPACDCFIPCEPGECISQTVEIWHMLATSVTHLCERINQECCHRKPPGYMRRVRQYMRPALCCDVEKRGPGNDDYVDVDFLKCECGNLVDPCIAVIVYPCHINRCGIHGPAFDGGPVPPISTIKMAPDLLGHMPKAIMQEEVSAMPLSIQMVPPKEMAPINRIVNKFGPSIPEKINVKHNLNELGLFKDFLGMNKIKFDNLDLFYNKEYNLWHGSKTFKDWKVSLDWTPMENIGYKLSVGIDKKNTRTKLSLSVKTDTFTNDKGLFEVVCNYDARTGLLNSRKSVLQSKVVKDDIGVFRVGWQGNLILKG